MPTVSKVREIPSACLFGTTGWRFLSDLLSPGSSKTRNLPTVPTKLCKLCSTTTLTRISTDSKHQYGGRRFSIERILIWCWSMGFRCSKKYMRSFQASMLPLELLVKWAWLNFRNYSRTAVFSTNNLVRRCSPCSSLWAWWLKWTKSIQIDTWTCLFASLWKDL